MGHLPFPRAGACRAASDASRARWRAVYGQVRGRRAAGQGLREIARAMELARGTVRRFAAAQSFPARAVRAPEPSHLYPHLSWLQEQLAAGRTNATVLWRALRARGFAGGPRQVQHWVAQRRLSSFQVHGLRQAKARGARGAGGRGKLRCRTHFTLTQAARLVALAAESQRL